MDQVRKALLPFRCPEFWSFLVIGVITFFFVLPVVNDGRQVPLLSAKGMFAVGAYLLASYLFTLYWRRDRDRSSSGKKGEPNDKDH